MMVMLLMIMLMKMTMLVLMDHIYSIHNDNGCIHMLHVCLCVIGKAAAATLEPPNKKAKVKGTGWMEEHRNFYTHFQLKWPPTWAGDEVVDAAFADGDRMKEATWALKQ